MTILTPELIEKVCRVTWATSQQIERDPALPLTWDEEISDKMRDGCRQLVRAAIEAALPEIAGPLQNEIINLKAALRSAEAEAESYYDAMRYGEG